MSIYLKRNRTLYRNLLDKEIAAGRELLDKDVRELDVKVLSNKAETCIKRLNEWIDKLDIIDERISQENPDDLEQLMSEDSILIELAFDCRGELETFYKSLEDLSNVSHSLSVGAEANYEMNQLQTQLQQLKISQRHASVKLPKLEIPVFNGDVLKWTEFWDTFEATIHQNPTLSDIEKLHYLNSKLTGKAKDAVSRILLSNENYSVAVDLLKDRFGDTQSVINCHYTELINVPPAVNSSKGLRMLYDEAEKHLRSLEALKQDINQEVFISIITSKIPKDVLIQLEIQKGAKVKWTVSKLRELFNDYISAREKAEEHIRAGSLASGYTTSPPLRLSAEALMAAPRIQSRQFDRRKPSMACRYCKGKHWNDECPNYPTVESRKQRIKGSCFICLKQGHKTNDCTLSKECYYCHQANNHHRSLCPQEFSTTREFIKESAHLVEEVPQNHETNITENVLLSSGESVLMQTAKTKVNNPINNKQQTVRILLDTGSQRTYITESLAKSLNLKLREHREITLVTFGSMKPQKIKSPATTVDITLKNGHTLQIDANVVPNIAGDIYRGPIHVASLHQGERFLKQFDLADTLPCQRESATIDILVGNDYYLDLILSRKVEVQQGLYLLESKLGWLLSGRTSESRFENQESSMLVLTHGNDIQRETKMFTSADIHLPVKPSLEDFWNLETIGITDSPLDLQDKEALKTFHKTLRYEGGRYHVSWPWKDEITCLPENRQLAFGRLKSLIHKLRNNPELVKQYDSIIQDQLDRGVIEKVQPEPTEDMKHYIPHHPVINLSKPTTKVRVVYDASAKAKQDNKSLNECLYRGPVMLQDLTGILLRFRLNKVAMVADIEKAFLQIGLNDNAKNVTRFFWLKDSTILNTDNNTQIFRFCRVPFGVISSPFLLAATLDFHLKNSRSEAAEKIRENIYVDNVITGTTSTQNATQFYRDSKQIMSKAGMNLRDWASNDRDVLHKIPLSDRSSGEQMKVLGLTWTITEDQLALNCTNFDQTLTKREVLKQIATVFDPLGIFSPITLKGKLFLQDLWIKKLDWDESLSDEDKMEWTKVKIELDKLKSCKFPRYIGLNGKNSDLVSYQLLGFCDASKHAYAAVVYLHQRKGDNSRTDLVFSKLRLAPNKPVSIPRLELLAALIGTRAIQFVTKHLCLNLDQKHLWSDSQCVLNWIANGKHSSRFDENRLVEIRKHNDITFHYIPSEDNPADLASRGSSIRDLLESNVWWHGPKQLLEPSHEWKAWSTKNSTSDAESPSVMYEATLLEGGDELQAAEITDTDSGPFGMDISRYSSMTKLLRVTALVCRFINRLKHEGTAEGPIQVGEIEQAEKLWIKHVQGLHYSGVYRSIQEGKANNLMTQLGVYIDEEGILRCHGRLEHSNMDNETKHPVLLHKKDRFTELLIDQIHRKSNHCGVAQTLAQTRHRFWIPKGRSAVKGILKGCTICRRWEGGPYEMPTMPPLPRERVNEAVPFAHCGIDYFGPMYIKQSSGPQKVWVCLYTCLSTRAIHLELMQDMTTEQFLLGLRRFVARHGSPRDITSDNAPQFKLAAETIDKIWSQILVEPEVTSYSLTERIRWKFIVELAPWMGGFYERLIGLVKRSLRKTIGKLCLTNEQLLTVLKESEAIINSRPLVYIGEDINSGTTLTPAHFLCLNPKTGFPNFTHDDSEDEEFEPNISSAGTLIQSWKKGLSHLNRFWQVWRDNYLLSLRERTQNKLKTQRIHASYSARVGDIVLIKEDLPRGCWKLGKIIELVVSRDQQVRSAKILLPTKRVIGRPLSLLYPVECSEEEQCTNDECTTNNPEGGDQNGRNRQHRRAAVRAMKLIQQQINDEDDDQN